MSTLSQSGTSMCLREMGRYCVGVGGYAAGTLDEDVDVVVP